MLGLRTFFFRDVVNIKVLGEDQEARQRLLKVCDMGCANEKLEESSASIKESIDLHVLRKSLHNKCCYLGNCAYSEVGYWFSSVVNSNFIHRHTYPTGFFCP